MLRCRDLKETACCWSELAIWFNAEQVRSVSVKAERPNHRSRPHARQGRVVVVGGGGVLHDKDNDDTYIHDSIRPIRLTVALGLKLQTMQASQAACMSLWTADVFLLMVVQRWDVALNSMPNWRESPVQGTEMPAAGFYVFHCELDFDFLIEPLFYKKPPVNRVSPASTQNLSKRDFSQGGGEWTLDLGNFCYKSKWVLLERKKKQECTQ